MSASPNASGVDPALIAGWVAARSCARGVAAPIGDHGGWRVDTRSDLEWCRYIFARADREISTLARTIERPQVFIKVCATDADMLALLPNGWVLQARCWVMTATVDPIRRQLAAGYRLRVDETDGVIAATILAPDGTFAASGYAAETAGVFAYDRIVTSPDHQRRGLGHAVMGALHGQRRDAASREILVATDQGRALYTSLGWTVQSAYASALSPAVYA